MVPQKQPEINLLPGQLHVSKDPVIITTLLGSCVAVCLYDPIQRIMGMNHFLLSNRRYLRSGPLCTSEAGRYGIHAMELIINQMLKLGANRKQLKAKAFGGSAVLQANYESSNFPIVGEINSRFVKEFLKNEEIPLIASDFGGVQGRKIRFYGNDYSVFVKKIEKTSNQLENQELQLWKRAIEKHDQESTAIDLW